MLRLVRRWRRGKSDTAQAVEELRDEVRSLAAVVDRLSGEISRGNQLSAPGPERSLILERGGSDGLRAPGTSASRVLCSLAAGPYLDLLAISSITFEAYAARHGYDLRLATRVLAPERPPAWSKIAFVRELLERYDEVLWVDADAIFVDISEDIAELVRPGKDLYLVEHVWEGQDWRSANTGVFLLRSTRWARQFLDRVWGAEEYIDHPWWENAAVLDLLGYELSPDLTPPRKRRRTDLEERVELLGLEWNSTAGASLAAHPRIRHHGRMGPISELRRVMLEDLLTFRRHLAQLP